MLKLLESPHQIDSFKNSIKDDEKLVLVPFFRDLGIHPAANKPCLDVLHRSKTNETIGLAIDHPDAVRAYDPLFGLGRISQIWVPDKKALHNWTAGLSLYDAGSLEYVGRGNVSDLLSRAPESLLYRYPYFRQMKPSVQLIPIYQLIEHGHRIAVHISKLVDELKDYVEDSEFVFLNDVALPTFGNIESNAMKVDPETLKQHLRPKRIEEDDFVYTQYSLFTAAGRPSCKFGGINFAALNKSDGSRSSFISRHGKRGQLIQFDFEAYHIRLIANLIGYTFPSDISVHEYFGKQYFDTEELTEEQYSESKSKTFHYLYSDAETDIPFFQKVSVLKEELWKEIQSEGVIESPLVKKKIRLDRIWEPSPAKVFNYFVQYMETERNVSLLSALNTIYKDKKSRIVLYTYDSVLIDYFIGDGKNLLLETAQILEDNKTYPIRAEHGKDYGSMESFRWSVNYEN